MDEIYDGAASALKGKGVSTSRIDELVNAGIDLKKHDESLSVVVAQSGKHSTKKADDIAEILGDEIIRGKYPESEGYVVFSNVKLKGPSGTAAELDTAVFKDGELVAFGQTKNSVTFNKFDEVTTQITDNKRVIQNNEFNEVSHGIDPSRIKIENIKETFTIGPEDAKHAYDHKLAVETDEIDEIFKSFTQIR